MIRAVSEDGENWFEGIFEDVAWELGWRPCTANWCEIPECDGTHVYLGAKTDA